MDHEQKPPDVLFCGVREGINDIGDSEWHIECRFKNGEKYAPIVVSGEHEALAHLIADFLNARAGRHDLVIGP